MCFGYIVSMRGVGSVFVICVIRFSSENFEKIMKWQGCVFFFELFNLMLQIIIYDNEKVVRFFINVMCFQF